MKILSLYLSMPSSASLYIDGKVVAATHEERFTRIKNDEIFPINAIEYCLNSAGLTAKDLDYVALASKIGASFDVEVTRKSQWSVFDYLKEQREIWKPKLAGEHLDNDKYLEIFKNKIDLNMYPSSYWSSLINDPMRVEKHHSNRRQIIADYFNIDLEKVITIEHHRCHSSYSYYASNFRNEKVLSFTVDGIGDGLNATIGIYDENGKYTRMYETDQCYIGRLYRYMTLLLGMKPNEHEFKVMGLAPYGSPKHGKIAYDIFASTLYVDGIEFKWKEKPTDSYYWFKERLEGVRFDNIAWGLQEWVEQLLITWVKNAIEKFGISKIIFSGGVAMNIKAMGRIAEMPEVESLFVGGSASDESMAISAGICLAEDLDSSWTSQNKHPIGNLFLGPDADFASEEDAVKSLDASKYSITSGYKSKEIAELLAQGVVLARCAGRMEFGQRALGNRSIFADPKDLRVKDKINRMIKNRDFWMPFAPIIIDKFANRYLVNPKNMPSPYMTIGFKTTDEGFNEMIAACHPADQTARPEILTKELNPEVYEIVEEFAKITGRGSILNTSFNLHGYPIVNTPSDAIYVLENSGLDGIILNNFLILKK